MLTTSATTTCSNTVVGIDPWPGTVKQCFCKSGSTGTPNVMPDASVNPLPITLDLNPPAEYVSEMYPKLKCYQGDITLSSDWQYSVK